MATTDSSSILPDTISPAVEQPKTAASGKAACIFLLISSGGNFEDAKYSRTFASNRIICALISFTISSTEFFVEQAVSMFMRILLFPCNRLFQFSHHSFEFIQK